MVDDEQRLTKKTESYSISINLKEKKKHKIRTENSKLTGEIDIKTINPEAKINQYPDSSNQRRRTRVRVFQINKKRRRLFAFFSSSSKRERERFLRPKFLGNREEMKKEREEKSEDERDRWLTPNEPMDHVACGF